MGRKIFIAYLMVASGALFGQPTPPTDLLVNGGVGSNVEARLQRLESIVFGEPNQPFFQLYPYYAWANNLIRVLITGGPGKPSDYVAITDLNGNHFIQDQSNPQYKEHLDWRYLNSDYFEPIEGLVNSVVHLVAPSKPGKYRVLFFSEGQVVAKTFLQVITHPRDKQSTPPDFPWEVNPNPAPNEPKDPFIIEIIAQNFSAFFDNDIGDQKVGVDDAGGGAVGWVDEGEWLEYNVDIPYASEISISVFIGAPYDGAKIRVLIDGNEAGVLDVINSGGWSNFGENSITTNINAGSRVIRLEMTKEGGPWIGDIQKIVIKSL